MFKSLFSLRSLVGTILLLVLVGEPTVSQANGLYTPAGFIVLMLLYFTLFHLFESLIVRYHLVVYQVFLLGFSIYAVLVTGFLHQEIADYVLKPQNNLITTLIRIQSGMFPVFSFYILNKMFPRNINQVLPVKYSVLLFIVYMLLLSPTGIYGILPLLQTFKITPVLAIVFSVLAVAAVIKAFSDHPRAINYSSKLFTVATIICIILGIIPSLVSFLVLLVIMPLFLIYFLFKSEFRNAQL